MARLHLIRKDKQASRPPSRWTRTRAWARRCRRAWAERCSRARVKALSPTAQILYAAAVALFGGWLIALWVVGLLLILFAFVLVGDALLREGTPEEKPQTRHEEILDRWRKAR